MESKINYLWRQFEEFMTTHHDMSPYTIQTFKACYYAGAFACAWRISKHLTARSKNDAWMDELILELDEAIRHQAAAEFAEEKKRESPPAWNIEGTPLGEAFQKHLEGKDE